MTDELTRFRADVPPADPAAMMRARAALVREATGGNRARRWWQVGITGAAVTAVAAAVFALPSAATRTPPASVDGLVYNPDGTITVDLREVNVRGANGAFHDADVRAVVFASWSDGTPKCVSHFLVPPDALADVVLPSPHPSDELTFRPDRIPSGMWLYIQSKVETTDSGEAPLRCDLAQQWYLSRDWLGGTASSTEQSPTGSGDVPASPTDVPTPSTVPTT